MPILALKMQLYKPFRFACLLISSSFSSKNSCVWVGEQMVVLKSLSLPFLTHWSVSRLFSPSAWLRSPCHRVWGQLEKNLEIHHMVKTKFKEEHISFLWGSREQMEGVRVDQGLFRPPIEVQSHFAHEIVLSLWALEYFLRNPETFIVYVSPLLIGMGSVFHLQSA